ncbi:MAG TPA: redoxin family protein [Fimbriimonadaceae bacterium]|nr:redoxin family protein [Fimbriimonadaceae bacterium]
MLSTLLAAAAFAGSAPLKAPDFIGTADDWINSKPIKLSDLKGKVVLVDFWEYTCVNCIRTFPYVKEWYERYHDKGLEVVMVHTPEFEFAKKKENVAEAVRRFGFTWPVLVDSQYKNWDAYGSQYWPNKYLIDKDGKIVFNHAGEGSYGEFEQHIQEELRRANPGVELPPIMEPIRPSDRPGAVCYPTTPEMYAGTRGFSNGQFGYPSFEVGKTQSYIFPPEEAEGVFYLSGSWTPQEEHLDAAPSGSALSIRYRAKEANIVLRRSGPPVKIEVLQDGLPIPRENMGSDLSVEDGQTILNLDQPRMYSVTINQKWGRHQLEFRPLAPGVQVYSFTFSTACENP